MHRPFIKTGPNVNDNSHFLHRALLISAKYCLPKLGDGDASDKTGLIFDEHDLRKTMAPKYTDIVTAYTRCSRLNRFENL